jgi:hypothetical protein
MCALGEDGAHADFLRVQCELRFALRQFRQHRAVRDLRQRIVGVLDGQPDGRQQERHQDDDVLRHLGPGDGAHAAQKRADQDAGQAEENADREIDPGEARGDQADRVDLRHHVGKRDDDGGTDRHQAHRVAAPAGAAAIARGQKIGDRVLGELAQVGRDQQRHQAVTAGPAHDVGQGVEAVQVQPAGQADEAGRGNPVGGGGHAVENGRHAAPGDVVFGHVRGAAENTDGGVQHDGGEHEQVADPEARHALLFQQRQRDQEGAEAGAEIQVVDAQAPQQRAGAAARAARAAAHAPPPGGVSAGPASSSARW